MTERDLKSPDETLREEPEPDEPPTTHTALKSVSHLLETDVIPPVPTLNLASTSFEAGSAPSSGRPSMAPPPPPLPTPPEESSPPPREEPTSPMISINTFGVERDAAEAARAGLYRREDNTRFYHQPSEEEVEEEIPPEPDWAEIDGTSRPEYVVFGGPMFGFMPGAAGPGTGDAGGYGYLDSITEVGGGSQLRNEKHKISKSKKSKIFHKTKNIKKKSDKNFHNLHNLTNFFLMTYQKLQSAIDIKTIFLCDLDR